MREAKELSPEREPAVRVPHVAASPVEKPVPGGDEAPPNRGACAGPRARSGRAEPCCPGIGTGVLLAGAGEAEGNEPDDVTGDREPSWAAIWPEPPSGARRAMTLRSCCAPLN